MIDRVLRWIKQSTKRLIFRYIRIASAGTYAQAGEDAIVNFLFRDLGVKHPTYLELGTNKPDQFNNTYLFYLAGSRGVCVEADSRFIPLIRQVRPFDTVIHAGVSVANLDVAEFFVFNEPSLSTFDREEARAREQFGSYKIVRTERVELLSINKLIQSNFARFPDFLSIDIEGLDLAVLKSLDFGLYPIPVICAETCLYSEDHIRPKNMEIIHFMNSMGYFAYADTYINTIFVNKEWFFRAR